MPCLINPAVLRSTQQPQRSYPVYFAHVLSSVLIYILSIFIASCTDITTTKMSLSCATQPNIFRDDTYPFTAMYDTDMNAVLNQDCSCNNQ